MEALLSTRVASGCTCSRNMLTVSLVAVLVAVPAHVLALCFLMLQVVFASSHRACGPRGSCSPMWYSISGLYWAIAYWGYVYIYIDRVVLGVYRDNGKENGNYYSILGLRMACATLLSLD